MVLLSNLAIGHDSFTINGLHVRGSVRKHLGLRPHNCTCRQPAILEAFANSLIISRRNIVSEGHAVSAFCNDVERVKDIGSRSRCVCNGAAY
jgi:hypothetical protein